MTADDVSHKTCGAFIHELLVCNFAGWLSIITVFFDGEPYSYTYPVGGSMDTPREAMAEVRKLGLRDQAQKNFLEDLDHLEMGVPH